MAFEINRASKAVALLQSGLKSLSLEVIEMRPIKSDSIFLHELLHGLYKPNIFDFLSFAEVKA